MDITNNQSTEQLHRNCKDEQSSKETQHKKKFSPRESLLTVLMETPVVEPIYNIFVAFFIISCLSYLTDSVSLSKRSSSWNILMGNFPLSEVPKVLVMWMLLLILSFVGFFGCKRWAQIRHYSFDKQRPIMDNICAIISAFYFILFLIIPCALIVKYRMTFAFRAFILTEQIRLIMKTYSFIRETVPAVLTHQNEGMKITLAFQGNQYLYFLFAPTLIYQDSYPRTAAIRWSFVIKRLAEVVGITVYFAFISECYLLPNTQKFGLPGTKMVDLITIIFQNTLPSLVIFIMGFFLILHSWQNLFAEILQFADRKFYANWWNSTDFGSYYRSWNMVVYNWLYTYIYKETVTNFGMSSTKSKALVIFVSSLFHEYILTLAVGFYTPLFIVIYGVGGTILVYLSCKHKTLSNIGIWFSLLLGTSIFSSIYLCEYAARLNCARKFDSPIVDFFYPRFLQCFN